ncbi:MAG: hypothetical protein WEE36_06275 [Acidimicrobiia bacterium]
MSIHPQSPQGTRQGVYNLRQSSPGVGTTNRRLTWPDGGFSTIHTPYYCYYLFFQ